MQKHRRIYAKLLPIALALLLPISAWAASINLYDAPNDTAKVTGSIDLAGGIIPIYTPASSAWMKVGDPRNGNTGWVKSSELKDSRGNPITFTQRTTENGNQTTQSTQINVGTPPSQQSMMMQQKVSEESAAQAQQVMGQALDAVKNAYQQSMQLMQNAGFPKVQNVTPPPQSPGAPVAPVTNNPAK